MPYEAIVYFESDYGTYALSEKASRYLVRLYQTGARERTSSGRKTAKAKRTKTYLDGIQNALTLLLSLERELGEMKGIIEKQ